MKLLKTLLLVLAVTCTPPSLANSDDYNHDGVEIAADVGLRFVGLLGTIIGTGLYIGISPFTAISHAMPPHKSFQKMGQLLVVQPAKYTFSRPVGQYCQGDCNY